METIHQYKITKGNVINLHPEIYAYIEGTNNQYMVSTNGNVISLRFGKIYRMSQSKNKIGYYYVNLVYADGRHIAKSVHRLVAEAFLPNPNNLPQINHINEDKSDNRLINLERCDSQYNLTYGNRMKISLEHRKQSYRPYHFMTNGIRDKKIYEGETIPDGYWLGRRQKKIVKH